MSFNETDHPSRTTFASPFTIKSDGWNKTSAQEAAGQMKEYWARQGMPWVRASVIKLSDGTYVVRSNLVNGKPPPRLAPTD